jgi:hypothetical protein
MTVLTVPIVLYGQNPLTYAVSHGTVPFERTVLWDDHCVRERPIRIPLFMRVFAGMGRLGRLGRSFAGLFGTKNDQR